MIRSNDDSPVAARPQVLPQGADADGMILLDYRQAAKALSIGQRTLSDLVKTGKIPVVRIGARVLFRPAALVAWARQQESTPVGQ